jgi:two-component system, cell cycle sensor histidine kinase and response regulator CckA
MTGEGAASFDLEFAESLANGLELLKGDFGAVLLNLCLTDSSGIETLRKVRGRFGSTPIFVLSESKSRRTTAMLQETEPPEIITRKNLSPKLLLHKLSKTPTSQHPHVSRNVASRVLSLPFQATADTALIPGNGVVPSSNGGSPQLVRLKAEDNGSAITSKDFIPPDNLGSLNATIGRNEQEPRNTLRALRRVPGGSGTREKTAIWKIGSEDPRDQRLTPVCGKTRQQMSCKLEVQHLSAVLDMMSDGIVTITLDGDISSWNEGAERIYGHPASDVVGQNISQLLSPSQSLKLGTVLKKARMGGPTSRFESVGVRRGGNTFPCSIAVLPSFDEDGKVVDATMVVRETHNQWRLDAQFRQGQKMEALGQLAGGMAHDFNNLLGIISGYSELLEVQLDQKEDAIATCEKIRSTTDRGAGLVTQLLAFSRQQMLEPKIININTIVSDTAEVVRRMVAQDIEIVTDLNTDLWTIRADGVQFQQVIMNLAVNARDAMPGGGVLRFQTDNFIVDSEYAEKNPPILGGKYVRLRATDNGTGIDPETKSHIFEPFFTTKSRGKGTGLGLATVYGIVKQSGGYIWVDSILGSGTTFSIYLPRVGDRADLISSNVEPYIELQTSPSGKTILLLDDDPSMLDIMSRFLKSEGYEVLPTGTAAEALRIAAEHDGFIHLFLTDIIMPGMSGPLVAEKLLHSRPTTRILFVSGHNTEKLQGSLAFHPARVFVQKPFTRRVLLEGVRVALATD